jgi:parallel beta-helix repeat protein
MRTPLALATAAAFAALGCGADSRLASEPGQPLSSRSGLEGVLVVDNDGADCPQAEFSGIQAAVVAAQPGDKILVCRGVYPENVLVETADLRIEARGAPGEVVLQGPAAQSYGFHLRNTSGVLLQGFRVQGFADANIIIDGGSGNTLRKNVVTAGVVDGIEVMNSFANVIEQNLSFANAAPNGDGIFVWQGSSGNIIRHNESFDNGQHGINIFETGAGNVVLGNRSHHNGVRGIQIVSGNESVIENNDVFANGLIPNPAIPGVGVGISVRISTLVTVRSNRSDNNGSTGIGLNATSRNLVGNNRSDANPVAGIVLNGASDNVVENNEVSRNGQDGIRLMNNADRNIVRLNHVASHDRDGIRVFDAASDGNTIERNVIRASGEHDAHDDSVGPGTVGTANFWLENRCATQNRPGLCEHPSTSAQ